MNKIELKLNTIYSNISENKIESDIWTYANNIIKYIDLIESDKTLSLLINKEKENLGQLRQRLPKAKNHEEYKIKGNILKEKLYINCYEDYLELTYIKKALQHLDANIPEEKLFELEKYRLNSLKEVKENKISKDNYFKTTHIDKMVAKVHQYLTTELSNIDIQKEELFFDKITGILHLNGKEIRIKRQKKETNETLILDYIFSRDKKDWKEKCFYTEMAADLFDLGPMGKTDIDFKLSLFTTPLNNIKNKIFKATGVEDLLNFEHSTKQGGVSINPLYIPK